MAGEKGSTYANSLLQLIFNGTTIANIAINATSSPLTNLYVSLHTADPTASGTQTSSEIAYTSYARVAVPRSYTNGSTAGFLVTGNSVSPVLSVTFPTGTGGSGTAAYFGIGTASTGTGELLYAGPISPTIVCGSGVTPTLTSATAVTES